MTDEPVDLARVRASRARLAAIRDEHPELTHHEHRQRFRADLSALLSHEDPPMLNDETVNLRVPTGTKARAAALCATVEQSEPFQAAVEAAAGIGARPPRASTSLTLRLALLRGLDAMEQDANREGSS
jgi:hypothetical protein